MYLRRMGVPWRYLEGYICNFLTYFVDIPGWL